ncbi:hypothetical protein [Candidatus Thioglobus sp.]|uniref:hypothetical protein n=1 Tax=Candidatus Thioglobus sp. TaxID=2026721 RepID=UPI003D10B4BE
MSISNKTKTKAKLKANNRSPLAADKKKAASAAVSAPIMPKKKSANPHVADQIKSLPSNRIWPD